MGSGWQLERLETGSGGGLESLGHRAVAALSKSLSESQEETMGPLRFFQLRRKTSFVPSTTHWAAPVSVVQAEGTARAVKGLGEIPEHLGFAHRRK